ncbi:hypothetical protein GLU01_01765 [Nanohaloarchaea archaeon]|nr:hypothetical protein [Candidatus Nanohaloarchaea archaeon]
MMLKEMSEEYGCAICGAEFPSEAMARTHIELSDAGDHESQSGFIQSGKYPEGKIVRVNPDGSEHRIKEQGKSKRNYSVSSGKLPDGISGADNVIIRQAVDKAGTDKVDNVTKFHEEVVAPALAIEGVIEKQEYVHTYQTTRTKLIEYFKLEKTKTDPSEGSEDSKDIVDKFHNLSDKQKQILREYSNGAEDWGELKRICGVDNKEAIEAVRGNIEIKRAIDDGKFNPESDTVDIGTTEVISEKDEESDSSSTEQPSQSIQQDQQQDERDQEKDGEQEDETQRLPYDKDELSSTKQDIVEHMARNPGQSYDEIANAVGCANSYPSQVQSSHLDTLLERGLQVGNELGDFQIADRRKNNKIVEYSDLTETQKLIISQHNKIKSETNKSEREIVQSISENNTEGLTTDGKKVSVKYVTAVIDEFSDLYDSDAETESEQSSDTGVDEPETKTESVDEPDTDEKDVREQDVERTDEDDSQSVADTTNNTSESDELQELNDELQDLRSFVSSSRKMAEMEIEQMDTEEKSAFLRVAILKTVEEKIPEAM